MNISIDRTSDRHGCDGGHTYAHGQGRQYENDSGPRTRGRCHTIQDLHQSLLCQSNEGAFTVLR